MSKFKIIMGSLGKCDVTLTMFNEQNSMVGQVHRTYDIKPTVKELLDIARTYKDRGAKVVRMTSTPSCSAKTYKL